MNAEQLRAWADQLEDPNAMQRTARLSAAAYLREQADRQERGAVYLERIAAECRLAFGHGAGPFNEGVDAMRDELMRRGFAFLFAHPAPQSVPEGPPTREMLDAARDWSIRKYGKAIGDDAAEGCWNAMRDAYRPAPEGQADRVQAIMREVFEYARLMDGFDALDGPGRDAARKAAFQQDRKIRALLAAPAAPAPADAVEALRKAQAAIRDACHAIAIYGDQPPQMYLDAGDAVSAALAAADQKEPKCD